MTVRAWNNRVARQWEAAAAGDWKTATEVYMYEERPLEAGENGVVNVKS